MAGKKTFTAGEVLTAGDVNDYLMDQSVMVFSGTAVRATAIPFPTEGMFSVTTDTDELDYYNGASWVTALAMGSWTAYTPTFGGTGFSTIGNATLDFAFSQIGKTVFVRGSVTWGTTTTATGFSSMTVSVPVSIAASQILTYVPLGNLSAAHSSAPFIGQALASGSSTSVTLYVTSDTGLSGSAYWLNIATGTPSTWASGDRIYLNLTYEAV
jgi:hypothetical protein